MKISEEEGEDSKEMKKQTTLCRFSPLYNPEP